MKKGLIKRLFLFPIFVAVLAAIAYSPVLAQVDPPQTVKIDIKPCFQCPTGTTHDDGTFSCPDGDGDSSPDWIPCDIPAINLCSKGKTAVAIMDFADSGIDPATAKVEFAGATAIRCSRGDVDHDVIEGSQPDDLVCHFYTRDLKVLQDVEGRQQVSATLTITQEGTPGFEGSDDVVLFKKGSCKGL
jgi:hypothetical protein